MMKIKSIFSIIIILFVLLSQSITGYCQTIKVKFLGNASIALSDGNTVLVTDYPYLSGYSGYMNYDSSDFKPKEDAYSLITHNHSDHYDTKEFLKRNWTLIGPSDIAFEIPNEKYIQIQPEIKINDLKINPYRSSHSNTEHYSYLLEWHGITFFFTGDTEDPTILEKAVNVDYLFITPWLLREAERKLVFPTTRNIIIYHQDLKHNNTFGKARMMKQNDFFIAQKDTSGTISYNLNNTNVPQLFAPEVISSGDENDDLFPAFFPSGKKLVFVRREPNKEFNLYISNYETDAESWSQPKLLPFSGKYNDQEPYINNEGTKLYFTSDRHPTKANSVIEGRNLWVVDILPDKSYGVPKIIGEPITSPSNSKGANSKYYGMARGPYIDGNGTLYFWAERDGSIGASDIFYSKKENNTYATPVNLGKTINSKGYETMPYISPGGSYLLFSGDSHANNLGGEDLYISFKKGSSWSTPKNLGDHINTAFYDFGPRISPDGKYLLFSSNRPTDGSNNRGKQNIYYVELNSVFKKFMN